jgi:hypothetical protein
MNFFKKCFKYEFALIFMGGKLNHFHLHYFT